MITAVKEIINILKLSQELTNSGSEVSISWIGGHADITGNELADLAAKEGSRSKEKALSTTITFKRMKKKIEQNCMKIWQRIWDNTKTSLHLKEIQDKVSLKRNSSLPKERKVQK